MDNRDLNAAGVPYSGCQFHTAWTLVASVEEVLYEAGCEAKIRYADVSRGTSMDTNIRTIAIFIAVEPPSLTRRALEVIPASKMPPYPDHFRLHESTDYPLDSTLTITAANGSRTIANETKYTNKALDRQKQRLLDLGVLTADMPTCTALLSHIQDIEN